VSGSQGGIELYVDPCCPFAWIAYQWLAEVRRHRAVEVGLHLMSLPMLNEHQSISMLLTGCTRTALPYLSGPGVRTITERFVRARAAAEQS
jgi:hypothetical protein